VFAAARRQAEHALIAHIPAQPAAIIHHRQGIEKIFLPGGFGVVFAATDPFVPRVTVVVVDLAHAGILDAGGRKGKEITSRWSWEHPGALPLNSAWCSLGGLNSTAVAPGGAA